MPTINLERDAERTGFQFREYSLLCAVHRRMGIAATQ